MVTNKSGIRGGGSNGTRPSPLAGAALDFALVFLALVCPLAWTACRICNPEWTPGWELTTVYLVGILGLTASRYSIRWKPPDMRGEQ